MMSQEPENPRSLGEVVTTPRDTTRTSAALPMLTELYYVA
jgi:hypothetical protein